ncbi:MAG TPA: hypothetical protein VFY28_03485 [Candidatus Paceibacterota bacterium]|nr:hypothetical protein [Candidatus Paceibacterota bacterium]
MSSKILRVLEPVMLVGGAVWAIGILLAGGVGDVSAGMRIAASFTLVAIGLVPYGITAFVLYRLRLRTFDNGDKFDGRGISRALLRVAALILLLTPLAHAALSHQANWPSVQEGIFKSNISNIQFDIPSGWRTESTADLSLLPPGYVPTDAILRKEGNECAIVMGQWNRSHWSEVKQLSFATRVKTDYYQFDGDWYIASSSFSESLSFSDNERQYVSGEYRLAQSHRTPDFVLFMTDGAPVPEECDQDLNQLLESVQPYYEPVHLTPESVGTLLIERVWTNMDDSITDYPDVRLVFIDEASRARYEVLRLPQGASHADRYSVAGNKLYLAVHDNRAYSDGERYKHDGALYVVDPFNKEVKELLGTRQADTYISSVYVRGGSAFYLASSTRHGVCISGYGPCPAGLYMAPLNGGESTLEAQVSAGQTILGYVPEEAAWYVARGSGDAGCVSWSFRKVSGGREESLGNYGACVEAGPQTDDAYQAMQSARESFERKASAGDVKATAIRIENGTLYPTDTEKSYAEFLFHK